MIQNNYLLLCTKSVAQELAHTGNSQWVYQMSGENLIRSKFPKWVCVCCIVYKCQYILHKVVTGFCLCSVWYLPVANPTGIFNDLCPGWEVEVFVLSTYLWFGPCFWCYSCPVSLLSTFTSTWEKLLTTNICFSLFCCFFPLTKLHDLWDLSSLNRDQTQALSSEAEDS